MAILQSRMIGIVNAGLDYQQALNKLIGFIKLEHSTSLVSKDPASHLQNILLYADELRLLNNAKDSIIALRMEQEHFARNAMRNEREAQRMRQQRAEDSSRVSRGVGPRRIYKPRQGVTQYTHHHRVYETNEIMEPPAPQPLRDLRAPAHGARAEVEKILRSDSNPITPIAADSTQAMEFERMNAQKFRESQKSLSPEVVKARDIMRDMAIEQAKTDPKMDLEATLRRIDEDAIDHQKTIEENNSDIFDPDTTFEDLGL